METTFRLVGGPLAAAVTGALEVEVGPGGVRPWRLPSAARRYAPPGLVLMAEFTAGVRLRLLTAASALSLDVTVERLVGPGQDGPAAPAAFVAEAGGAALDRVDLEETGLIHERLGEHEREWDRPPAPRSRVDLRLGGDGREREVLVWLPQDAAVLLHAASSDAPAAPAPPDGRPRWIHYGSSISHGGSADGPTGTWPALAARALGLDGVNLGFGGNAMLDPLVARAIAAADADVVSLKVGVNIVGADAMRLRTLRPALHGFLDTIRDGHPAAPLVVVTAIGCPAVEHTPGPIRADADGRAAGTPRETRPADGTLTLALARQVVAEAVRARQADDPNLFLLDGTALLSPDEAGHLPDGLHPNQGGHTLIAARFAALARDPSGLARAFAVS